MIRLAWCPGHSLHGGMTQQETFAKQGCVESLTACGLGHISLVGAPLALFLLKQERQLLSPVCPIDMAAGLTSASSCVHGVSCGHTSLAAPTAAVGLSSPQTSELCHLRTWHLTEGTPERTRPVSFQRLPWSQLQGQHRGVLPPSLSQPQSRSGTLVGSKETVIRSMPFPAHYKTTPA